MFKFVLQNSNKSLYVGRLSIWTISNLSDLKFKIANHERDFKNAFRTLQNVMSFNDLNNIHIDDLLSKLDSSYKNYVCHSNTFFSISKS